MTRGNPKLKDPEYAKNLTAKARAAFALKRLNAGPKLIQSEPAQNVELTSIQPYPATEPDSAPTVAESPAPVEKPAEESADIMLWQGVRIKPVPDPVPPKPLKYVYSKVVPAQPVPDPVRDRRWRRHGAGPVSCGRLEQAAPVSGPRKLIVGNLPVSQSASQPKQNKT